MAKKSSPVPTAATHGGNATEETRVGPREPCPCGSGRRYKACHGKGAARAEHVRVLRPFQGLADEADLVAMREIVPAATAQLTLADTGSGRRVTVVTVLPMAMPALVRADESILLATQVQTSCGDVSRDLGDALSQALTAPAGTGIASRPVPAEAPRMQDLVDMTARLEVRVEAGFDFWLDGVDEVTNAVRESMDRANAAVVPTARLAGVQAAYWARIADKTHLRWVLPHDENPALDAFARLHASGGLALGEGTKYVGAFRALGLLVPVWDLVPGTPVEDIEEPAAGFAARLAEAMASTEPLSAAERRARSGLTARQLTLH